jgi:hypothetical protein
VERWQETLGAYAELTAQDRRTAEGRGTPRLSDAEAMDHAAEMAECYHRKNLRTLRRYKTNGGSPTPLLCGARGK